MSLTVKVAGRTDIGCVRQNNEDNFGYDTRYGIYVVCDGMGGQAAGEVASKMGVDTMLTYFRESADGHAPQVGPRFEGVSERASMLGSAIQLANGAIYQAAQAKQGQRGMGSTIVSVLVEDDFYSVGNAGDSRIYLIRNGQIEQITNDHSLVMEQVRRGLITREEAAASEMQNIIIRALGPEESVQPDLDDRQAWPGDVLVLCSDGLTRHVSDENICQIVTGVAALSLACDELIEAARDGGGHDNITCLLLKFEEQTWWERIKSRLCPGGGSPKWQNSI